MKTPFLLLSFSMFLSITWAQQITVTDSDFAKAGDTVRLSVARSSNGLSYKYGGADTTWDFSTLRARSQQVDTFLTIYQTSGAYAFYFGNVGFNPHRANIARKATSGTATNILLPVSITEPYDFYYKNSTQYVAKGIGEKVDGVPTNVGYSDDDVLYNFPLNYGDADTSNSGYSFRIPNTYYSDHQQTRVNHVDGWGTVITPLGSFQALRVVSVITSSDSTYIDTLNFGYRQKQPTVKEYKWIAKDQMEPVIQINTRLAFGNNEFVTAIYFRDTARNLNPVSAITETGAQAVNFTVFPNPANDHIAVFAPDNFEGAELTISDISGRLLIKTTMVQPVTAVSTQSWAPGIYLVAVSTGQNKRVRKIMIE
jgi:hypothetical protein